MPGTLLLDVTDPDNDDNGPGNYAYPTSATSSRAPSTSSASRSTTTAPNVIFRVQTRDLTPTFGSPLGAQLVDVYVHDPGAATTSTAASFPQRNYTIARRIGLEPADRGAGLRPALHRRQRQRPSGPSTSARTRSRASSPSASRRRRSARPGPGWGFTVVLTGQDGFSPDQARGFQPTPQDFQFGVCATASADPHCTFDPGTVPKAVDVITPAGVLQSDELDYTIHSPVTISGVTIPVGFDRRPPSGTSGQVRLLCGRGAWMPSHMQSGHHAAHPSNRRLPGRRKPRLSRASVGGRYWARTSDPQLVETAGTFASDRSGSLLPAKRRFPLVLFATSTPERTTVAAIAATRAQSRSQAASSSRAASSAASTSSIRWLSPMAMGGNHSISASARHAGRSSPVASIAARKR